MAHDAAHVWYVGEQRGRGRCNYASLDAPCEREYHNGQVRSGCYVRETESAIQCRAGDSVPIRSHAIDGYGCNCLNRKSWALNSAVECHLHTVEVIGSNPIAPTSF